MTAISLVRIAAAQYPISYFHTTQDYQAKIQRWVEEAVQNKAQLLLFPEYASLELGSLLTPALQSDLAGQLEAIQAYLPLLIATHQTLAQQHQITIVAGSFPEKTVVNGQVIHVNRSYVFHPDGRFDFQDKQIMTRFENEEWFIASGTEIKVIDTAVGKVGISICYDSEFPLIARQQIEKGADFILVPSVTESLHGYHRVRIGSQARALENQCYVVHAPLVGEALWSPAVDISRGCAGVYTPVDQGFPEDGILIKGQLDQAAWIYADLDLAKTHAIRTQGTVLNHRDWAYQQQRLAFKQQA